MEKADKRDTERLRRVGQALRRTDLQAVICMSPTNVLLLTGYWPVVGMSLAIASNDERVILLVPEDEQDLAQRSGADEVRTFQPASLTALLEETEVVAAALRQTAEELGLARSRIGYEAGAYFEPSSYASMHIYNGGKFALFGPRAPAATLVPADALLARQRMVKTPREIAHIRVACGIAEQAFAQGRQQLQPGLQETEAAAQFRVPLSVEGTALQDGARADGYTFCMSGPNGAQAYAAYQRSRDRRLEPGDLVLIHCNSYVEGYWTDITRTYCLGECDARQEAMFAAVFAARQAALDTIRPGVLGRDVDRAAREVMDKRGFGTEFRHAAGHGVGFAAINHNALPRLHPCSSDILEVGMVFNVEPAIYIEGYGGLRHCDMVVVTPEGAEVLTPFAGQLADLSIPV